MLNKKEIEIVSLISIIKGTLNIFYAKKKKQFFILLSIIFFSSIIEVISFSLIIPVIYLINDATPIQDIKILHFVYDSLHFNSTDYFIMFLLFGALVIFIFKNLFLLFAIYFQNKFAYSVANDILERQMTNFYKNDYLDIKKNNSIEYLRCLVEAPQSFADNLMMPMVFLLNEIIVLVLILVGLLFYKSSVLILLFISVFPIGLLFISLAKKKLQENSDIRNNLENNSYLSAMDGINGYTDIKLFSKEDEYIKSIRSVYFSLYKANTLRNIYILIPRRIIEVLVIFTICILFLITSFVLHTSKNDLVLLLLTFSTAAYRLLPSLNEIVTNIVRIKTSGFILDLLNFIKTPPVIFNFKPLKFIDKIVLSEISFQYKEKVNRVLCNLNFTINKGDFIVLSGDSGSGKTTIGKILTGFIKQDSGNYFVDGVELQHINQIKKIIGYVTQDFYLFDKTLIENIAVGEELENVDLSKIEEVLRYTNLSEFVNTLPFGIYQPIGEMGAKLSGGQKQRIAIARALYKNIEFLVLDEATSSLDKETELELINTIYDISKKTNLTVLLITHRVSSVRCFDAIYELKNGKLIS